MGTNSFKTAQEFLNSIKSHNIQGILGEKESTKKRIFDRFVTEAKLREKYGDNAERAEDAYWRVIRHQLSRNITEEKAYEFISMINLTTPDQDGDLTILELILDKIDEKVFAKGKIY